MSNSKSIQEPTENEIAVYAYHLWESEGCVPGRDVDYWLQAKAHLIADRQYEAGLLENKTNTAAKSSKIQSPAPVSKPAKKRRSVREPAYA